MTNATFEAHPMANRLSLLVDLASLLTREIDFDALLRATCERVAEALAAERATIWLVGHLLAEYFAGSVGQRLIGTMALIGAGSLIYFTLAWVIGAMNKDDIMVLLRRKKPA